MLGISWYVHYIIYIIIYTYRYISLVYLWYILGIRIFRSLAVHPFRAPCCDCACESDPPRPASSHRPTLHWFPSLPSWSHGPDWWKHMEVSWVRGVPLVFINFYRDFHCKPAMGVPPFMETPTWKPNLRCDIGQKRQNWRIDEKWNDLLRRPQGLQAELSSPQFSALPEGSFAHST